MHLLSCILAGQGVDMIGYVYKLFRQKKWQMRKVIFTESYLETSYNHMKYMILYQRKILHSILLHIQVKIIKNSWMHGFPHFFRGSLAGCTASYKPGFLFLK